MADNGKKKKSQTERDEEMQKLLDRKGEKDVTREDFLEAVKKVSKKKPSKGSGK